MKKYILILTCMIYCALGFSQSSFESIVEANNLYKQGKLDEAIAVLDKEIEKNDINLDVRYARSFIFSEMGNEEKALSEINVVLKYEPSNLKACYMRATIYEKLGQHENALNDVNNVLRYFPYDCLALNLRGCIYQNTGMRGEALLDFDNAINYAKPGDNNIYGYYYSRAGFYYEVESFNYAMNDIEKALSYNPTDYRSLLLKSRILNDFNETGKALETINLAITLYPKKKELYYLRINYYLDSKNIELAKKELDNLVSQNNNSANYHFLMARYYACLNDKQNVIKELELYNKTKYDSKEKVIFDAKITVDSGSQINLEDFDLSTLK